MAQDWRYQNGLYLYGPSTPNYTCGLSLARWVREFPVYLCGRTALDNNDAGWDATDATGVNGASVVGHTDRFEITGDAYTFTQAIDQGSYLTITGFADPKRNGIYRIVNVLTSKIVQLDVKHGVHEDGIPTLQSGLTWRLWNGNRAATVPAVSTWCVLVGTYRNASGTFHLKITTGNTSAGQAGFPQFQLSPYATWNAGSHAFDAGPPSPINNRAAVENYPGYSGSLVWAIGDQNAFIIFWRDTYNNTIGVTYIGEFTPFYPGVDPKPATCQHGNNQNYDNTIGSGYDGTAPTWNASGLMLGADQLTTTNATLCVPAVLYDEATNRMKGGLRKWSGFSTKHFRHEIAIRCIDAGQYEWRGKLIDMWVTGASNDRFMPFGASLEYLHCCGGLVIPWNGSKVHHQI